jgi:hypothetical protein
MTSKGAQLLLGISSSQDADEQELAELTQQLRAAVLESDADAVEPTRGAAPTGAKGDPVSLAERRLGSSEVIESYLWCLALIYAGMQFGTHWKAFGPWFRRFNGVIGAALIVAGDAISRRICSISAPEDEIIGGSRSKAASGG